MTSPKKACCYSRLSKVLLGVLLVVASARVAAVAAEPVLQPPPEIDFLPPEWTTFAIDWKPTWDETLAANAEADWRKKLAGRADLQHAADAIVILRRIELRKALIQRFPDAKDAIAAAHLAIASDYGRIGFTHRRTWHAWQVARDDSVRADLRAEAYRTLVAQPAAVQTLVGRHGAFAFPYTMALAERAEIPPGHPAAVLACEGEKNLICATERYDLFGDHFRRFKALAARHPQVRETAIGLLRHFGEYERARELRPKEDNLAAWLQGVLGRPGPGALRAMPEDRELLTRWEAFTRGGTAPPGAGAPEADDVPDPAAVQKMIDQAIATGACVRKSDSHTISFEALLLQALDALPARQLAPLRAAQERDAAGSARAIRRAGDWDDLNGLARRYPYAQSVHAALVESGEAALRSGRHDQAIRAFLDVLRRSRDKHLREAARTGLSLVRASGAAAAPPAERPANGTPSRRIRLPADWPAEERHGEGPRGDYGLHAPWPLIEVERRGGVLLLTGPARLACFAADGRDAVWDRPAATVPPPWTDRAARGYTRNTWRDYDRRPVTVRGAAASAVAGNGRAVFRLSGWPPAVEALDVHTGEPLWSTRDRPEWAALVPMSRPATSHGRAYVLAVPAAAGAGAPSRPSPPLRSAGPWYLACLDGRDGALLWKRAIGWPLRGRLDVARYGCAVSIREGAVYCSTNMGLLARCDAGHGGLAWVRGYPGAVGRADRPHTLLYSREGGSPQLAGERLLIAPRDHSGVMALHRDTGALLWETLMVPSDRIVGVSGKAVVVINARWLAALDIATGTPLWFREFPAGTQCRGTLVGTDALVVSGDAIHRIDAATGKPIQATDLRDEGDVESILFVRRHADRGNSAIAVGPGGDA